MFKYLYFVLYQKFKLLVRKRTENFEKELS